MSLLLVTIGAARAADPDAAALVARLGSANYGEREEAQRKLRELGGIAITAVKKGVTSSEAEIARRCRTLLPLIRADEWDRARTALKAGEKVPVNHPVWKRFATIAGDDAASRRLFLDMIVDEKRTKLLDEAFDEPEAARPLYAAEVARVEHLCRYGISKNEELKRKGMVVGAIAYHPPNAELATLLLIGTLPATAKSVSNDGTGERVVLFDSLFKMGQGVREVRSAMQRLLAAWTAARGTDGAIDVGLELGKEWWMPEMLPVARRLAADDKQSPKIRANAVLLIGQQGDKTDIAILRRIAESPGAAEPFEKFNEILKGQAELDGLWGRVRFGVEPKPTKEDWAKAYAAADIRTGTLALADCAWAAAINCAGGDAGAAGFLWRWKLRGHQDKFPPWLYAYGFESDEARKASYAKAAEKLK
jgi:hypothetical protein